ncbi:MAG: hypothetical protein HC777_02345 [Hyphomonadaceae bacterium]|nr:hypothetical protein [Hyphomonadaceae bacterium]
MWPITPLVSLMALSTAFCRIRSVAVAAAVALLFCGPSPAALADFERALEVNPRMPLIRLRVRELREQLKGRAI